MNFFKYFNIISLFSLALIVQIAKGEAVVDKHEVELLPKESKLGEVSEAVERVLWVVNHSESPIVVRDIKVDCSCTKVKFKKEPIMAGDSLAVEVRYIPRRDASGVFYKTIKLYTTNSQEPVKAVIRGKNIKN